MIETGWLIENRYTPGPSWWRGTDSPEQWTPDRLKAVRFCRKQDAEAAMATLPDVHMCFVSEHQYGFGDSLAALYRETVEALERLAASVKAEHDSVWFGNQAADVGRVYHIARFPDQKLSRLLDATDAADAVLAKAREAGVLPEEEPHGR